MSWSFHLQKINTSFEQIASWYRDFMHRTEMSFQAMHQRILRLEDQAYRAPSDEQVERVLRKILAEKFSESDARVNFAQNPNIMKEEEYFVEDLRDQTRLASVAVDPSLLFIDPEAVPSKAYATTMRILDRQLMDYPNIDQKKKLESDMEHMKTSPDTRQPKSSRDV